MRSQYQQLRPVGWRAWPDRLGMWASAACAVHCVLTPFLLAFSPALMRMLPGEDAVHRRLAVVVTAMAGAAVFSGFRKHRRAIVLLCMLLGVAIIAGTAWFGDQLPNHATEVCITLLGSALLITAHRLNHTFCRACECVPAVCRAGEATDR